MHLKRMMPGAADRMICNHQVAGSKPAAGNSKIKHLAQHLWLAFCFMRCV
jgi:hypothetical protein